MSEHHNLVKLESLGSKGILRVLETVTKHGPLNISLIGRKTDMNYKNVDAHVKKLIKLGLLEERRYGSIRMIKPAFTSFEITLKRGLGVKLHVIE